MEDHVVLDNCLRNQAWMQQVLLAVCLPACVSVSLSVFLGFNLFYVRVVCLCTIIFSFVLVYVYCLFFCGCCAVSALTLLVGHQEEHPACKK